MKSNGNLEKDGWKSTKTILKLIEKIYLKLKELIKIDSNSLMMLNFNNHTNPFSIHQSSFKHEKDNDSLKSKNKWST